ncbi:hypothetical protein [Marinimicrococcus flavescens]|uniref:Uncharacterized protein n=1 Tax=Marinimicrococcus flavescens TaxID=3031815 RepID=A0AAP3XR27_9PROT|nr:hypothetical protein [Marinimicrococcus flavescens]
MRPAAAPLAREAPPGWAMPLLFVGALALFAINLDLPAHFDELYHLLAAQGWLATGEPVIAEGEYRRGLWFTVLVAGLFDLFGQSELWIARLPSVLAAALSTLLLFRWLHATAGRTAAWIAALLFATAPFTLELARFARFYAIQELLFLAGAVAVEGAVMGRLRPAWRLLAGGAGLLCLALAVLVQPASLIGLVGLALWFALAWLLPWLAGLPPARRRSLLLLGLVAGLVGLALLFATPLGGQLLGLYRWTPPWAEAMRNQVWFYHLWLALYYPSLWPVVPVLALLAWRAAPRPALLAICVFGTSVLLQSFGGLKDTRYLAYAWPFLFALFGLALAGCWPALRAFVVRRLARLPLPGPRRRVVQGGLVVFLLFAFLANAAVVRSVAMLADLRVPPQPPWPGWERLGAALGPELETAELVLVTNELAALRHLGRYDLLISHSRLMEVSDEGEPFARDYRTGRPVIAEAATLDRLMGCFASGLVVSEEAFWRDPATLDEEVANLLVRRAEALPLPAGLRFRAWRWTTAEPGPMPACREVRGRLGRS